MLKPRTRWSIRSADQDKVTDLVNELKLTPLIATLLVNRGIDSVDKANSFLFSEEEFHSPYLLRDMDECIERIHKAIANNERIVVYGDYDADGVTSTYVMLTALKQLGANAEYYIPNRFNEGYGPNEQAFRNLKNAGFDLIITVDNGIAALHEANVAKEIGIDLIITDHHEPGPILPEAVAIIHPKRADSIYPFKELAGVGVAFKVATALLGKVPEELLPFAAIGTIADLVSMHGENRMFVKKGLSLLRETDHIGLLALMKQAGVNQQELSEETVGFGLAPRINAPGRLDSASIVVDLFLTNDAETAQQIALEINDINIERQEIVAAMTNEAIEMAAESIDKNNDSVILVGKEGWHPGVIGIVASRLVEKFYRPVFVFSYDSGAGLAKGSARSIPGFNLYENLSRCKDILPHFGGHPMAAGMTLNIHDIRELHARLNEFAKEQLRDEDFIPITELDGVFFLKDASIEAVEQMQLLSPFGMNNPKPKILIKDVKVQQMKKVGADEKHLKVAFSDGEYQLDGIGFDLGNIAEHISSLSNVSVIGELGINEWNNTRKSQIFVKDMAVEEWQLFDYRGHKNWQQWIQKVPDNNRKIIVFNERTFEQLHLQPNKDNILYIETDSYAEECNLNGANVILLDMPPTKKRIELLISGKQMDRIYAHFYQDEPEFFRTLPTRQHFAWYYTFLLKKGIFDIQRYGNDLAKYQGWTQNTIQFMTKVFFELDFVTINNGIISVIKQAEKRDLSESSTYQKRQQLIELEQELVLSNYQQLKKWFDQYIPLSNHKEANLIWI